MIDNNDPMQYLRLNNSFDPTGNNDIGSMMTPYGSNTDAIDEQNLPDISPIGGDPIHSQSGGLLDQFHPSTSASDRLSALIDNMPHPQKPSILHRILGGIVGAGYGPDAAMRYNQEPYNQAMTGWLNQSNLAQKAASDENVSNNQQRQLLTAQGIDQDRDLKQQQANEAAGRKQSETERENKAKDDLNQQKLTIAQQRADAYQFKQTHNNWVSKVGADGNLVFFNPQDPTQEVNTHFNTGKMDDYDKLNFGLHARLQEIGAQGQNQQNLEDTKQGNRVGLESVKEGNREQLLKFKPGASNPFGTTTETTTSVPPGFFGRLVGNGPSITKEVTSVKTPNQATTNAQAYSPQIEQSIADAIKMHPDIYPDRASVIAALKAKGTIK